MTECYLCGKSVDFPFICNNCGFSYCNEHRMMWNHSCKKSPTKQKQLPRKLLILIVILGIGIGIGSYLGLGMHFQGSENNSSTQDNTTNLNPTSTNQEGTNPSTAAIENIVQSCSFTVDSAVFSTTTCGDQVVKTMHPISIPLCTYTYSPNGGESRECTKSQTPAWLSKEYTIDPINVTTSNGTNYIQFQIPAGITIENTLGSGNAASASNVFAALQNSVGSFDESAYFGLAYNNQITQNSKTEAEQTSSLMDLKNYALVLINDDRSQNGKQSVKLSNNTAAQIQAEDILNTRFLSHWMSNGEKPYMVYTDYGGRGAVEQNIAYSGYSDLSQCNDPNIICTKTNPTAYIKDLEWQMVYNDSDSNWGHKENILDSHHTDVSIGIAYDDYYLVIVQNFENHYINYISPLTEKNGIVSFTGNIGTVPVEDVNVFYDPLPSQALYQEHKNDKFYDMGDLIAIVQPPPENGTYYIPNNRTSEIADTWIQQGNQFELSFDISPFVTKAGVYTAEVVSNDSVNLFPLTTYSISKTTPMVQEGFKSPKVYYSCTENQLVQYDQLQQQPDQIKNQMDPLSQQIDSLKTQYETLSEQYNNRPQTATSDQEYQQDTQMYNQLNSMQNQINSLVNQYNILVNQYNVLQNQTKNFRC